MHLHPPAVFVEDMKVPVVEPDGDILACLHERQAGAKNGKPCSVGM